jgi:type IV pilus assembly protein PilY1
MSRPIPSTIAALRRPPRAAAALLLAAVPMLAGAIDLADSPLFSTVSVPGNLILALSVEWPTATTPAYPSTTAYTPASTFLGYFDPAKCYQYVAVNTGTSNAPDYSTSYFQPYGAAAGHACTSSASTPLWSGNYLNWASMQTLDAFRWILTGGYRSVDTVTTTVLTKTYAAQDVASVIPQKTMGAATLAGATPFTSDKWTAGAVTRIRNLGTRMWISGNVSDGGNAADGLTGSSSTSGAAPYIAQSSYADKNSDSYAKPNRTYELYINVRVCDRSVGVESDCVAYGSNYKPEGLMQQYASKLRYSAFGYYNHTGDTTQQRDGGVMRARMKYIGPSEPVPGSAAIGNAHPEWDSATGVMIVNPDPDDATATQTLAAASGWSVSIPNSGVMNYLNKFGYAAKSYKEKDPVSELYYAALRYYKNLGNVGSYTTLANAGNSATAAKWLDGFPAITSDDVWKKSLSSSTASYGSPMLYACQKNFILGIGDVNTHRDANLYGSTIRSSLEPALPPEVSAESADTITDVKKATDMVGQLEGFKGSSLGGLYADSGTSTCASTSRQCSSYFIAGLAYDAHTRDIRTDLAGTQTVNTYWMDVLEGQVYKHKNQYWLAAKYGGFDVPASFSPYAAGNGPTTLDEKTWHTSNDTLSVGTSSLSYATDSGSTDKRPDNYFPGNQPETMQSGLTAAFAKIVSETSAATGTALAVASPNIGSAGTLSYASTYNPQNWTGELVASKIGFSGDGTPTGTGVWDARDVLDTMVTSTDTSARKIVTCCTSAGTALPFTAAVLSSASLSTRTNYASFANVTGASQQSAANFVDYLRGASKFEVANGGAYRTRSYRLGDIVDSKPTAVAGPSATYYDVSNPGYSSFKKAYANRKTVVYVGANDGMLHAFDGSGTTAAGGGKELFAYVPSFVYGTTGSAATSGLAALGNPSYSHHYFVDATPQVFDVDFGRIGSAAGNGGDWHSLLIGGLGKGGTGYFAIDVTDPSAWTSEAEVAKKVLWEFTDSRMGYSYGAASVVKTRKYGWVAILTSGYDNSDGKGWFFFVNPKTGALLEAVSTPEGSTSAPLNLAHHTAFVPDYTDFTADAVYAADLQGNVWRLVVSGTGSYPAPVKIAQLTSAAGTVQPVTTRPLVEIEPNSKKRYVFIGTGRLLADSDIASGSGQSFYAIVDGNSSFGGFGSAAADGSSFPVVRAELQADTNLLAGIGSAPDSALGWYFDLSATNGIAERIDVQPTANNGVVAFAANLPSGDTCSPSGTGRSFAVDFATGKTVLSDSSGALAAAMASTTVIRDIAFERVAGKLRLYAGNSGGLVVNLPATLGGASSLRQISWREVRTTE